VNGLIREKYFGDKASAVPVIGETLMLDTNKPDYRWVKGDMLRMLDYRNVPGTDFEAQMTVIDKYGHERTLMFSTADLQQSYGLKIDPADKRYRISRRHPAVMFPYAITCHKAQGSEWNEVVLFNDCTRPETRLPYLYTGATRARSKLTILGAPRA
jgi:exodeoxyribonuclease-5